MPAAPDKIVPVLVISFVGWRVVSRIRRSIGRQRVTPKRMLARIGIYGVLTLLLGCALFLTAPGLPVFAGLTGGLALGAVLGWFGLHLTRFETTAEGRFYTPNPYMGAGVSFLLVGRLVYRFLALSSTGDAARANPHLVFSPLTLLLYGVLAGYYVAYFIGILVRSKETQGQEMLSGK
jgi:hypothetical protein